MTTGRQTKKNVVKKAGWNPKKCPGSPKKTRKEKQRNEKHRNKHKTNNNMANLNPNILIITLNGNG